MSTAPTTAKFGDDYKPAFPERWRHGGWYTNNRYPNGACGCVHNNHANGPGWYIDGDDTHTEFPTRDAAARAEHVMIAAKSKANNELLEALRDALQAFIDCESEHEQTAYNMRHDKAIQIASELLASAAIAKATE